MPERITLENVQTVIVDFLTDVQNAGTIELQAGTPDEDGNLPLAHYITKDVADLVGILLRDDSPVRKPTKHIQNLFAEELPDGEVAIKKALEELTLDGMAGLSDELLARLGERIEETFDVTADFPPLRERILALATKYLMQRDGIDRIGAMTVLETALVTFNRTHKREPRTPEELMLFLAENT